MELLNLKPSQEQRQELVDNILAVYDRASLAQLAKGMNWYSAAHDLAGIVGDGDYSKGAGIIAALSANTGWAQNEKLALATAEGQQVKHFPAQLAKVAAIQGGTDPATVLGKGLKTQNFYRNIARPNVGGPVTVDRHAHDIARGEVWGSMDRGLSTPTRYGIIKAAYQDAAALRGIRPHELQAVTWVVWTESKPRKG